MWACTCPFLGCRSRIWSYYCVFSFSSSDCIQERLCRPFCVLSYAVSDCKYCGNVNCEYWRPMREWYTGKPPFPWAGGHLVGWGWRRRRRSVSEVGTGEKWFSASESQKGITNLGRKDEKLSVKKDPLEPFGIIPGWCSLDVLPSLGLCWVMH